MSAVAAAAAAPSVRPSSASISLSLRPRLPSARPLRERAMPPPFLLPLAFSCIPLRILRRRRADAAKKWDLSE